MKHELIYWLQNWYADHCDGDWEHDGGIEIATLDNPGWSLHVDLTTIELALRPFPRLEMDRTDNDWIHCWVGGGKFHGVCGPHNLLEMLAIFRLWVEQTVEKSP